MIYSGSHGHSLPLWQVTIVLISLVKQVQSCANLKVATWLTSTEVTFASLRSGNRQLTVTEEQLVELRSKGGEETPQGCHQAADDSGDARRLAHAQGHRHG